MAGLTVGDLADDLGPTWVAHAPGEDRVDRSGFNLATPRLEQPGDGFVDREGRAHVQAFADTTSTGCREWRTSSWLVLPSRSSATPPLPRLPTTMTSAFSRSATSAITVAARPSSMTVPYLTPATFNGLHHLSSKSDFIAA